MNMKRNLFFILLFVLAGFVALSCTKKVAPAIVAGKAEDNFDMAKFNYYYVEAIKQKLMGNGGDALKYLEDAVEWFNKNDIPLFGINDNPIQREWSRSPKIYANIYIDDAALGCPLRYHPDGQRPWVDWLSIKDYFKYAGII